MATTGKRDYYEVLGVTREAPLEEIKKAYKKLAIQHHPDRNPDDAAAEERFKEASEAYAVLQDPEKRRRYDRLGHSAFGGGDAVGPSAEIDFSAVTEMLEGLLGDMFGGKRDRRPARDLSYELTVSFAEAARGTEKTITVARSRICGTCKGSGAEVGSAAPPCPACRGSGVVRYQRGFFAAARTCQHCKGTGNIVSAPCPTCRAEGVVPESEELVVRIPPGVEDRSVRTVRGAGEKSLRGAGDLHVHVHVEPHPLFTREGDDILLTVPITFPMAVLGGEVEVPTLDGKVTMKIPAGSQSGRTFRLRGKGIASFGGGTQGDQLVTVMVEVPARVSRQQRRLLEELAGELGIDTHPQQKTFLAKLKGLFG